VPVIPTILRGIALLCFLAMGAVLVGRLVPHVMVYGSPIAMVVHSLSACLFYGVLGALLWFAANRAEGSTHERRT